MRNGSLLLSPSRVVLIGQAPSASMSDDSRPLVGGKSGTFLQELAGLTLRQYVKRFVTLNLLEYYPGKNGKGDRFPMMDARIAARELTPKLQGRIVVFVGSAVAEAFGAISPRFFEWRLYPNMWSIDGFQGAPMPHPSGINLWWNEAANLDQAKRFFKDLADG